MTHQRPGQPGQSGSPRRRRWTSYGVWGPPCRPFLAVPAIIDGIDTFAVWERWERGACARGALGACLPVTSAAATFKLSPHEHFVRDVKLEVSQSACCCRAHHIYGGIGVRCSRTVGDGVAVLVRYSRQQELRYMAFAPHEAFSAIIK